MKFIPAIDLKDQKCVRLKKGNKNEVTVFNKNPVDQAIIFEKNGCERIHIVDLDGAFGKSQINKDVILEIRKNTNLSIELGGGIKNENDISFWINSGIDFLIIGSLAIKNKNLISDMIQKHKNKIYIALDVFKNKIMIKGWVESSNLLLEEVLNIYNNSLIKGYIITDISRDGMLEGLDIKLTKSVLKKTKKNIIVGGGLSNYQDLINLKKIKNSQIEGVIAGKSFYSGSIEIKKALQVLKSDA